MCITESWIPKLWKIPMLCPILKNLFSALSGSQWFSVLDLKSGYYQIEMEESDKYKTAFSCPLEFWEFNRMSQGIINAPSTFQRLMEKCIGYLHLTKVLVFFDDLIVFSQTPKEHEETLKSADEVERLWVETRKVQILLNFCPVFRSYNIRHWCPD